MKVIKDEEKIRKQILKDEKKEAKDVYVQYKKTRKYKKKDEETIKREEILKEEKEEFKKIYEDKKSDLNWFDKDISDKMWMPTDINLKKPINIINNTWFNCKEYKSNLNNEEIKFKKREIFTSTKSGRGNKDKLDKTLIVEIKPNNEQKKVFKSWFESYRLIFNMTLKYLKRYYKLTNDLPVFNETRDMIKNRLKQNKTLNKLIMTTKINSQVVQACVNEVFTRFNSCISNLENGHIDKFNIRYWKKDRKIKTMKITNQSWTKDKHTFCSSVFGDYIKVKTNEKVKMFDKKTNTLINKHQKINITNMDVKANVHYNEETNRYFLYIFKEKPYGKNNKKSVISLDPGLRTFQTGYTDNSMIEFGINIKDKIEDDLLKINKLISIEQKKRRIKYLRLKLKHKQRELHNQTINFLCSNYETIIIGRLYNKQIVKKGRKLSKINKNLSSFLSQFEFLERLKAKALEKGNNLIITGEYLTSKLCTCCGKYNNVGASKIYECSKCMLKIDRDFNGARNIQIKTLNQQKTRDSLKISK